MENKFKPKVSVRLLKCKTCLESLEMFVNGRLQFDGESHDVESFLKLFVYEALMFNWDRAAQARAIECCLKGKALQIFNGLNSAVKSVIDEVMKALRDGCRKSPDYYLNLFYMRVLNPDESIASFCHDIVRIFVV